MHYLVSSQLGSLAYLYVFAAGLAIGLIAFYRWKFGPLRFWFAANCLLAGIWSLSNLTSNLGFRSLFLFFFRLGSTGWIFVGPTLFIFLAYFLGREDLVQTRRRRLLLLALAFPFWAAFVGSPGFFSSILRSPYDGHYLMAPNFWFAFILVSVIGWAVAQLWVLVSSLRRQFDPLIRRRSRVLLLLLAGMSALGIATDVILPALNYYAFSLGGTMYGLFCMAAFAMIQRFQLLPSAQTLNAKVDQLQEFSRTLEQKVEERTHELRESGQRYREIIENVHEIIVSLDLEGRIVSYNPQIRRAFPDIPHLAEGKSIGEVIGPSFPPALLAMWLKAWQKAQAELQKPQDKFEEVVLLPAASGEQMVFMFTLTGIFREGRLVGYLMLGRDITESRRAEKALQESEARFREIFESAQDVIFSEDLEGRILSINPQIRQMAGIAPEDILGKTIIEVAKSITPGLEKSVQAIWEQQLSTLHDPQDSYQREFSVPLPSGESRTFLITLSGLFREGKLVGYLGIARDITESVKLKNVLEEYSANLERLVAERTRELEATYQKLAESARLAGKAEMAAGVLHNLGNAFNSINVRLAMIRDQRNLAAIEQLEQALDLLAQNRHLWGPFLLEHPQGKQLLPFLRQWTETSRHDRRHLEETLGFVAGRMGHIAEILQSQQGCYRPGFRAEPTDLNQTIKEALSAMEDSLQKRGVKVEQELGDLPRIELDRSQVMQVIYNLVKNAMEAVEPNPEGDRRICLRSRVNSAAEQGVEIAVEDNGVGIRSEDLPRMFEFGFTTKADSGGHGFGLQASANYIQSLGGRIEAESPGPGRGAKFRVSLPLIPDQAGTGEEPLEKEAGSQPDYSVPGPSTPGPG
jgi:PAS domain S-box-containing protein